MEKQIKKAKIEIRLTVDEKQQIKDYAEEHGFTISELVRLALVREFLNKEDK